MASKKQGGPGKKPATSQREAAGAKQGPSRRTPPIEDIDAVIAALQERLGQLSHVVDVEFASANPDPAQLTQVFALYAQTASRLGRLLRDRQALSGDAADALAEAVGQVLDELSAEWGVTL
jgi:hypothetical protein